MKIRLTPVPPYDFDLSASIFAGGDRHIRNYENGQLRQVIRVEGHPVLAVIESVGTIEAPELSLNLNLM
jgi:hypothetical protein